MPITKMMLRGAVAATLAIAAGGAVANPGQYIAKMYTEALGRAPDATAWQNNLKYFASNGCNQTTLKDTAVNIYTSAEYNALGYDNVEKVLTAYRGIFSREPDSGMQYWVNYLNGGGTMTGLVTSLVQALDSGEIGTAAICRSLGYGWRPFPVLGNSAIPAVGTGVRTLAELKTALSTAASGSTVYLAQRAVIHTDTQIVVPSGVTLATTGLPGRTKYAKQARIVRNKLFATTSDLDGGLIKLMPGAKLNSVWTTGQRQILGYSNPNVNISFASGYSSSVVNSRSENAPGWATILVHRYGKACGMHTVSNNLVTGYSNIHERVDPGFTDGISGTCESFSVTGNEIIDASDVGIIFFSPDTPGSTVAQRSVATNNTVIAAGVSAYAAFAMDALDWTWYRSPVPLSFDGASISNNKFWAAPDTHFDIGLAVGTWPWSNGRNSGSKGRFYGNTNAGIITPMNIAIVIDGMFDATVQANALLRDVPKTSFSDNPVVYQFRCESGNIHVHNTLDPHASGTAMQGPFVSKQVHGCIGH